MQILVDVKTSFMMALIERNSNTEALNSEKALNPLEETKTLRTSLECTRTSLRRFYMVGQNFYNKWPELGAFWFYFLASHTPLLF
jgi:hypothetical protein